MSGSPSDEVVRAAERLALCLEAGLAWDDALRQSGAGRVLNQLPRGSPSPERVAVGVAVAVVRELGSPAVEVLRRAGRSVRDERAADRARAAAVAGPAASARVVGALPLAGPLVAWLLGTDPVAALLGTGWGRTCGVVGLLLLAVSWWWAGLLVRRAARAAGRYRTGVDDAVVCDLVAAALQAGVAVVAGLRAVAQAVRDVPGADAHGTSRQLLRCATGVDAGDLRLVAVDRPLRPLVDALEFSTRTGCAAASALVLAAEQIRRDLDVDAALATARLAVQLVLPLGLTALPGFLLLGVAPVVIDLVLSGMG